jgi:hypothetical protein
MALRAVSFLISGNVPSRNYYLLEQPQLLQLSRIMETLRTLVDILDDVSAINV